LVKFGGGANLLDFTPVEDGNPVADGKGFLLVMGDKNAAGAGGFEDTADF
jgi:hypothetical protein